MRVIPLAAAVIAPLVGKRSWRLTASTNCRQIFMVSAVAFGAMHRQPVFSVNVIIYLIKIGSSFFVNVIFIEPSTVIS